MDHEKQTTGDIKQWEAREGCSTREYMIINTFCKTLPSTWKIDWNKARDGGGNPGVLSMASFWSLFFLHSLPPLYIKLIGSSGSAGIFSSRHGDVICIIEVE